MKRAKLRELQRNAAVALGNVGDAVPRADDAGAREHAVWALAQLGTARAWGPAPGPGAG